MFSEPMALRTLFRGGEQGENLFVSISKSVIISEISQAFIFLQFSFSRFHWGDMTGTPPGPPGGVDAGHVVVLSSAVLLKKLCCKA